MPKYKYARHDQCPHIGSMVNEYESATVNRVVCLDCGLVLFRNNTATLTSIPLTAKPIPTRVANKDRK